MSELKKETYRRIRPGHQLSFDALQMSIAEFLAQRLLVDLLFGHEKRRDRPNAFGGGGGGRGSFGSQSAAGSRNGGGGREKRKKSIG